MDTEKKSENTNPPKFIVIAFLISAAIAVYITDSILLQMLLTMLFFCVIAGVCVSIENSRQKAKNKQRQQELEKQEQQIKIEQEKRNLAAKEGKWNFPAADFYRLCRDNHITDLNNEYSTQKALKIAKELIEKSDIDVAYCSDYLSVKSLKEHFIKGQLRVEDADKKLLQEQKMPRAANPIDPEKKFIERASELSRVSGCDKRVKMLSNLSNDYSAKIVAMREGEKALMQLGMIYADQQKKESSWAVMGGIAEGIAGPAAGIMAASNTMENNRKIREYNASMRKASMDILSGIPSVAGDRYQLEEERVKIDQKRNEAKNKVVLSKPTAEEIWQNIKAGKATVKKNPSGVLKVALPVTIQKPFALDVPDGVEMVVDGTIKGEVWFEDNLVGEVFLPLPIYGIPSNMTAEVTLDGMCGRSVEFEGEYTVKIADTQNLWIMEA